MDVRQIEYYESIAGLDQYGILVCGLIRELLADADIQVHSVTYRVKDIDSVLRKLDLKAERYNSISELTDLLGVRVVTYFSEDVDKVAKVIKGQFHIDMKNSVDKRASHDPNQFGYLSLHFVASISKPRSQLTEYKRYAAQYFELQVRSILQHAWAEIEHDLGYKAKADLPNPIKRRFFRLIASLELADEEFERLRRDISEYKEDVDKTIKESPQDLPINQSTLTSSYENEEYLNRLDEAVAKARQTAMQEKIDPVYMAREADDLRALGIKDIEQLHDYTVKYYDYVVLFAEMWSKRPNVSKSPSSPRGIGLFYLSYVLAAQHEERELKSWGLKITSRHKGLVKEIKVTWKEVLAELGLPMKAK